MTLVELLVYTSLVGLPLACIYAVFAASMRYFRVAQAATELQADAQKTVVHLVSDLADSRISTVKVGTNPTGVIVLSPRDQFGSYVYYDFDGDLYWQKWVCYYLETSNSTLVRKELYLPNTVNPPGTPATSLPSNSTLTTSYFQSLSGAHTRTVATDCTAFTITATTSVSISATFERTVFSNAAGTSDNRVTVLEQVKPRN